MRTLNTYKINQVIAIFLLYIFSWLPPAIASAESDPVGLLQNVANKMLAGLKVNQANLKTKPGVVYSLAYKYIVPHADLNTMSKRVLPPTIWNNATSAQRAQFQHEFTISLIRTYASTLSAYKDQTVKFFPVRGNHGNTIVVNSEINSPDNQPIQVSYRLIKSSGEWKLYDLSVEGVSMLESFRSQFSDILSTGSMSELLRQMGAHNRR